jgi:hypothetical protein
MASDTSISVETPQSSATPVWMKRVPMITGVLAGLAGFLTVRSANMSNQAIYNSNQAVLHQAQASDAWAEYQAESLKRHMDQVAIKTSRLDASTQQDLEAEIKKMRDRQDQLTVTAKAEETLRAEELNNGQQKLAVKDLLDYAGVAAQLGIALASVAALTRVRPAYHLGIFIGAIAIAITVYALAGSYIAHLVWRH